MFAIDDFFQLFPKATDETEDEFNHHKYAMEDKVHAMMVLQGTLNSIYQMSLPFRVDPTVRRVRILGTSDGCRFAHVDLAERKKIKVEEVIMLDKRKLLPTLAEKNRHSYSNQ